MCWPDRCARGGGQVRLPEHDPRQWSLHRSAPTVHARRYGLPGGVYGKSKGSRPNLPFRNSQLNRKRASQRRGFRQLTVPMRVAISLASSPRSGTEFHFLSGSLTTGGLSSASRISCSPSRVVPDSSCSGGILTTRIYLVAACTSRSRPRRSLAELARATNRHAILLPIPSPTLESCQAFQGTETGPPRQPDRFPLEIDTSSCPDLSAGTAVSRNRKTQLKLGIRVLGKVS